MKFLKEKMIYYILFCKKKHNFYEISFDIFKKKQKKIQCD